MTTWLRSQTQGEQQPYVFLMVDATDDETAETGLTPVVQTSLNGQPFVTVANPVTAIGNGFYYVLLDDIYYDAVSAGVASGARDVLVIRATAPGANEWREIIYVVNAHVRGANLLDIANAMLTQPWTAVSDPINPGDVAFQGGQNLLNAARSLRNRVTAPAGGPLRVYREDDVTVAWQAGLNEDPNALPISGIIP